MPCRACCCRKEPRGPDWLFLSLHLCARTRRWQVWLVLGDCTLIGLAPVLVHMAKDSEGHYPFRCGWGRAAGWRGQGRRRLLLLRYAHTLPAGQPTSCARSLPGAAP